MAYLRKQSRSPYWFAGFTLPDGTRTQRTTKTTDRTAAMKLALKWEDAARDRITEAQARRVISDIHEIIHGAPLASPTVAEYVAQWLKRKEGETKKVTFDAYKGALKSFCESIGDKANQQLNYITPAMVSTWRDAEGARTVAKTANNKLKVLRTFFQTAWRDGIVTDNPAAKVQSLRTNATNRRGFTLPELKAILKVANNEWRGMVLFGLYTGQRLKDIASLTWGNYDAEEEQISLVTSKTGRAQILPLAKPLKAYLAELEAGDTPNAPLFPNAYKIATSDKDSSDLSESFYKLLVTANLAKPRPTAHKKQGEGRSAPRQVSEITFHSLRHTATSLLKNAGVSEAVARDIIGHDSAEVSRHYTHIDEATKRKAIAKLPDITK